MGAVYLSVMDGMGGSWEIGWVEARSISKRRFFGMDC